MNINSYGHSKYFMQKQFMKLFGGIFRIFDPAGALAFYVHLKEFKLKEDIRVYTDEDKVNEVLTIKARSIIDISAAYDVFDPTTQEKVGVLKRKGLKSTFLSDEWIIMDAYENEVGYVKEENLILALLRRHVINLIPQNFVGSMGGVPVLKFAQHFNPFVLKMDLDFSEDIGNRLDRRLGIAAAILLCAIEGRQN